MMKLRNFDQNLWDLIHEAHKWEYTNINDNKDSSRKRKPILFFTKTQLFLLVIAVAITLETKTFNGFAGYVISGLALFLGVLFTMVVSLFDKFKSANFAQYKKSINEALYPFGVRLKNYYKKTIILTLYIALIAMLCILMLSFTVVYEPMNKVIDFFKFVHQIDTFSYVYILKVAALFVFRVVLYYFLLNFLYITKNLISSLFDFMISEIDQVKLK